MDPLVVGAIATFAGIVATTVGNVVVGRMNTSREKEKSAEDAATLVQQERLEFKDEQIAYWKSRYEACLQEHDHDEG